jgi:DNA-binding HxlR family transcriptional regulator
MLIMFRFELTGMKNKPVRHRLKSINQLIDHCKQILLMVLDGEKNVNAIFREVQQTKQQTGLSSYKRDVLDGIKMLQQAGLIREISDLAHKQKQVKQLTPLGQELAELMDSIDRYNKAYSKLRKARKEHFNTTASGYIYRPERGSVKVNRSALLSKGMTHLEIDSIYDCAKGIGLLEYESASYVNNILLFRCASMLPELNKTGKAILNRIITDTIASHLEVILSNIEDDDPPPIIGEFGNHTALIMGLPAGISKYPIFTNRLINKESKEILTSMFSLLKPKASRNDIQIHINNVKKNMDIYQDSIEILAKHGWENPYLNFSLENLKEVVAFYEVLLNKSS